MASFRDSPSRSGKKLIWTLHTHFDVDRSVPTRIELIPTGGARTTNELRSTAAMRPMRWSIGSWWLALLIRSQNRFELQVYCMRGSLANLLSEYGFRRLPCQCPAAKAGLSPAFPLPIHWNDCCAKQDWDCPRRPIDSSRYCFASLDRVSPRGQSLWFGGGEGRVGS